MGAAVVVVDLVEVVVVDVGLPVVVVVVTFPVMYCPYRASVVIPPGLLKAYNSASSCCCMSDWGLVGVVTGLVL